MFVLHVHIESGICVLILNAILFSPKFISESAYNQFYNYIQCLVWGLRSLLFWITSPHFKEWHLSWSMAMWKYKCENCKTILNQHIYNEPVWCWAWTSHWLAASLAQPWGPAQVKWLSIWLPIYNLRRDQGWWKFGRKKVSTLCDSSFVFIIYMWSSKYPAMMYRCQTLPNVDSHITLHPDPGQPLPSKHPPIALQAESWGIF